jgi:hypothetical protein
MLQFNFYSHLSLSHILIKQQLIIHSLYCIPIQLKMNRWLFIIVVVGTVLAIPLIAMQFTPEVSWSAFDFLIAGLLLLAGALALDVVLRKVRRRNYRIALLILIVFLLAFIWIELAVGLLGTPFGGT